MQRSGSGWFETLLNNHTNISSNGEIFSVKPRRSNVSTIVETLDRIYNLDWFSSASKNECTAAVGLKWMLTLREDWTCALVEDPTSDRICQRAFNPFLSHIGTGWSKLCTHFSDRLGLQPKKAYVVHQW